MLTLRNHGFPFVRSHGDRRAIPAGIASGGDRVYLRLDQDASAIAVDPRKVQELVRNFSGAAGMMMFGAGGTAVAGATIEADSSAGKRVDEASLGVAVLARAGVKLSGLVFFGGRGRAPRQLVVELLDAEGRSEQLVLSLQSL